MSKRVFLLFVAVQLKWKCYLGISTSANGVLQGGDETTLVSHSVANPHEGRKRSHHRCL